MRVEKMSKNNEDLLNYIQEGYQNQKSPIQVGKGVVSALETIILPYVKKIQTTLGPTYQLDHFNPIHNIK